jgi:hypothetical protein
MWRLRGDPAFAGGLDAISYKIGIIGKNAWCLGPAGEFVFLSADGLYMLGAGGEGEPQSLSRERLPQDLRDIDTSVITVSLEYSARFRGVFIFLTDETSGGQTHYWYDWANRGFWPLSYAAAHEPTATCEVQPTAGSYPGIILGGQDGTLRMHSLAAETDDGTNFTSYVNMGPFPLAQDSQIGRLLTLEAVIAEDSGNVTWSTHPADTFEAVSSASSSDSGTWVAGQNAHVRPACRGQAASLKITGTAGYAWALESVVATVMDAGRRKTA